MPGAPRLVLSCEHGGYDVPAAYERYFRGAGDVLRSHRGWDPGALALARRISQELAAPLVATEISRLVVEVNRSEPHPHLFSRFTRDLDPADREEILARYYRPHRNAVERAVMDAQGDDAVVVHVGVHSFTPVLDGRVRDVDIGLLYDPRRSRERELCRAWAAALRAALPRRRVKLNAPYRGWSDGLTTWLRARFPEERYLGIELEVGQGMLDSGGRFPDDVETEVAETLRQVLRSAERRAEREAEAAG